MIIKDRSGVLRFGKPCIKGLRIPIYDVLGWFASGMIKKQIIEDYQAWHRLRKKN